jgi:hypothetical protein
LISRWLRRLALQEFDVVPEAVQEHFIVRTQPIEESIDGLKRISDLVPCHAAAGVEHEAEADRHSLGAEQGNLHRPVVLVDDKVVLAQS